MTFNYARFVTLAINQIADKGQAGAIRRTSYTDSNNTPWDPSDDTATVTDHACTLLVDNYAVTQIDGTLVQQNDRKVYVSTDGLTITPTPADQIVVGGVTMSIINVQPLSPGGTVILYQIQARG